MKWQQIGNMGDAKATLSSLIPLLEKKKHTAWIESFAVCEEKEYDKVISKELFPADGPIQMGEVVRKVSEATANKAILVTDVGQNQMF